MIHYTPSSEQAEQPSPPWSPRIIHIRAAVSGLDSPCIPFAVLKDDPMPNFRCYLEANVERFNGQDSAHLAAAIEQAWNEPFAALRDDQRFFFIAWGTVPGASPIMAQLAGLSFGIATPGPHYKRWLTTYAVKKQGELAAWCEMIDMRGVQEELVEIVLSEERMIRLMPASSAPF